MPTGDYQLPLSSAEVLQEGTDLTIVSYGPPLYTIEGALHLLKNPTEDIKGLIPQDLRNLSVELIDLRTIAPYDVCSDCDPLTREEVFLMRSCLDRDCCQECQEDRALHRRSRSGESWWRWK